MGWVIPEMRLALRTLRRQPGVSALLLLMLTLGVASNVAVFSLVDGLFLRSFPFPQPDRLIYINETAPRWNLELVGINYADFAHWREEARVFEAMSAFGGASYTLSAEEGAERIDAMVSTHDFPRVLGVEPVLGRFFTAEEDVPDGPPVVVLTHGMWRRRFAGDPGVVGRTLRLDARDHEIIGVLPAEAEFPYDFEVWVPLGGDPHESGQNYSYDAIGRMRTGVTLEAALADLERAHVAIWERSDEERVVSPLVRSLRRQFAGDLRPVAIALAGAVMLVLLAACANIASVLLARASARRRETGIRIALGARGTQLLRQFILESLILSTIAGIAGTLIGFATARFAVLSLPDQLPAWMRVDLDARVVLFAVAMGLATTLLFGWAPVLQVLRRDVRSALGETGRSSATRNQRRIMSGLVLAEVALAAVLLVSGALLLQAFERVRSADPGFRTEDVLRFRVELPQTLYPDAARRFAFQRDLLERLRALPGVTSAGAVTCPPLTCHWGRFYRAEGAPPRTPNEPNPVVLVRMATPGYLETAGIAVLAGRSLEETDTRADARAVAVINASLARQLWPDGSDPVGRRFTGGDSLMITVVGVSADIRHYGLERDPRPGLYLPVTEAYVPGVAFVLRTSLPPDRLAAPARAAVAELDPRLAVHSVETMAQALRESLILRRTYSAILALFALLALLLAVGGIYGVLSYAVTQRTREIGIRVALGARRASVLRLILRHGLLLVGGGLVLGFLGSFAAQRVIGALLAGIPARNPITYLVVAALLAACALSAMLVPVRRALAVDPMRTLRQD